MTAIDSSPRPADPDAPENYHPRIVIIDGRAERGGAQVQEFSVRERLRRAILAMSPESSETTPRFPHRSPAAGGGDVGWKLLGRDDVILALRARTFATAEEATTDAWHFLQYAGNVRSIPVRDADTGTRSWWIAHRGRVVLTGARLWTDRRAREVHRELRLVLRTVAEPSTITVG